LPDSPQSEPLNVQAVTAAPTNKRKAPASPAITAVAFDGSMLPERLEKENSKDITPSMPLQDKVKRMALISQPEVSWLENSILTTTLLVPL
jgi:hypothetical protein